MVYVSEAVNDSALQVALAFINENCTSTHGNVRVDSIFISPSGEWKLGGFELLSNPKDDAAVLYVRSQVPLPRINFSIVFAVLSVATRP